MKAVIVGNGPIHPPTKFLRIVESADVILAADGGAAHCLSHQIVPHYIVGDFDSVDAELETAWANSTVFRRFPKDKDLSDLELAYLEAEALGATTISVFSWADERFDYTWSALLGLQAARQEVVFYGSSFELRLLNSFHPTLNWSSAGQRLSIGTLATPVSLNSKGLKWELGWNQIESPRLSLSNQTVSPGRVDLEEGSAFVLLDDLA